jgi:DNA-binding NtrC family response regulator
MRLNSSERKKILFVDDDSDITTISKAGLERNGFEVQTFGSPISALENFRPGSYDLLVVDIKMRDMNDLD